MTLAADTAGPVDNSKSLQSALRALPYRAAQITGGFWANTQQVNRSVSLPHGFAMLEQAGNLRNLRAAVGLEQADFAGFWFADSDVYKWLEAVGWELGRAPDAGLQEMADAAIALVEAAQQADGYLNSYFQTAASGKRWTDLDHGHELYCAGHLIQAAVAWHRAVGRRSTAECRPALRRPHLRHVWPRRTRRNLRPPGDRDGAGRALPRDGRPTPPRPGPALHRPARPQHHARPCGLRPGLPAGSRACQAGH